MRTEEEKRWERLQQRLLAESRGDGPARISSTRTLFGIKSHVEQVIEKTVAQDESDRAQQPASPPSTDQRTHGTESS